MIPPRDAAQLETARDGHTGSPQPSSTGHHLEMGRLLLSQKLRSP